MFGDDTTTSTDPFADFDNDQPIQPTQGTQTQGSTTGAGSGGYASSGGQFAQEICSVQIKAEFRTFYIDLKQSKNGKFFKISEKSRGGQKSTIMFDATDLDQFINALQSMKARL